MVCSVLEVSERRGPRAGNSEDVGRGAVVVSSSVMGSWLSWVWCVCSCMKMLCDNNEEKAVVSLWQFAVSSLVQIQMRYEVSCKVENSDDG